MTIQYFGIDAYLYSFAQERIKQKAAKADEDGSDDRRAKAANHEPSHKRCGPIQHKPVDHKVEKPQSQEGNRQGEELKNWPDYCIEDPQHCGRHDGGREVRDPNPGVQVGGNQNCQGQD